MGIYTDNTILGIRILVETQHGGGSDYYVSYEFINENWKENAINTLPHYLGKPGVKIQTLHPFSSSHNLYTGQKMEPGNIWLDNNYFKLEDLEYI
jgi:hypothetical protein